MKPPSCTESPYGLDQISGVSKLGAQPRDMRVNGSRVTDVVVSPDIFQKQVAVLDPARPLGKSEEQFVFGGGEDHLLSG